MRTIPSPNLCSRLIYPLVFLLGSVNNIVLKLRVESIFVSQREIICGDGFMQLLAQLKLLLMIAEEYSRWCADVAVGGVRGGDWLWWAGTKKIQKREGGTCKKWFCVEVGSGLQYIYVQIEV